MNGLPIACAILLLTVPLAAAAADKPALPPGATLLHLNEHAEHAVPRDEIVAVLRVEATGKTPLEVEAEVNRRMAAALAEAKKTPAVAIDTPSTNVHANHDTKLGSSPSSVPTSWTATESLQLRSKDFAATLTLVGKLEEQQLAVTSLAFGFSREALAAVQGPLTAEALQRLRERAEAVAGDLGMAVDHIDDLVVGDAAPQGPRQPGFVAGSYTAEAQPVAEAGEAPVRVVVTAQVVLQPKR